MQFSVPAECYGLYRQFIAKSVFLKQPSSRTQELRWSSSVLRDEQSTQFKKYLFLWRFLNLGKIDEHQNLHTILSLTRYATNKGADQLHSAFVFTTQILQSLYFLYTKIRASIHLLWLCSSVCVKPGRRPHWQVFSWSGSNDIYCKLIVKYFETWSGLFE